MSDWTIEPKTAGQQELYMKGYRIVYTAACYYMATSPEGKYLKTSQNLWDCWQACRSDLARSSITDCRTPEGVNVGLVDAIITVVRTLRERNPEITPAFREALKDLTRDEDFNWLKDIASHQGD